MGRAIALCLIATALAAPSPSSAAATSATGSLRLVTPSPPVLLGDTITLAGRFKTGAHRDFFIQRAQQGSRSWSRIPGSRGTTNGRGHYRIKVVAPLTYRYRAVLVKTATQRRQHSTVLKVPAISGWAQVAAGGNFTCGIWYDRTAWCWGDNSFGQLGVADNVGTSLPPVGSRQVLVNDGSAETWLSLTAGGGHTCGIRSNQTLWCWGENYHGQLGTTSNNGTTSPNPVPLQVLVADGHPETWLSVDAGGGFTCAIRTDHALWCWGGSSGPTPAQVLVGDGSPETWLSVTGGGGHTCAIRTDHSLWCWGANGSGQLGTYTDFEYSSPDPYPDRVLVHDGGPETWLSVSGGAYHTCAIRTDHSLWCWGADSYGRLGTTNGGTYDAHPLPLQVLVKDGGPQTWRSVNAGYSHTCAIRHGRTLWCWGENNYGQLGVGVNSGSTKPNPVPTRVRIGDGGAEKWRSISTTYYHSCSIRSDHQLWCWGYNYSAQLDNRTNVQSYNPNPVPFHVPPPGN